MKTGLVAVRARRRRRGAALVEALVVIPFFIIAFAGLLFLGSLYRAKLHVMRLTKEAAWSYAMANCGTYGHPNSTHYQRGGEQSPSPQEEPAGDNGDLDVDLDEAKKAGGSEAAPFANKSFGSATASMRASVAADSAIGAYTKSVSSTTRVMCNEAPYNGDLEGFLLSGWQSITRW